MQSASQPAVSRQSWGQMVGFPDGCDMGNARHGMHGTTVKYCDVS